MNTIMPLREAFMHEYVHTECNNIFQHFKRSAIA